MNRQPLASLLVCAAMLGCGASTELRAYAPATDVPLIDGPMEDRGPVVVDVPQDLTPTVRPDAVVPGPDVVTPSSRTYDYALVQLSIDSNTSASFAHTGFNLDGRYSPAVGQQPADCDHRDFYSSIDPDQNRDGCTRGPAACVGGVDNQFPELASASQMLVDWRQLYATEVAAGRITYLLRVEGVESLINDNQVIVSIFKGHPMFPSCGRIGSLAQPYAIDQPSLLAGVARFRYAGVIRNGRLSLAVAPGSVGNFFELPTPSFFREAPLGLSSFNLRVTLTPDAGVDGNLGGRTPRANLITVFTSNPLAAMYRNVIEGLVNGLTDIQTMNSCDAPNGAVGMGMGFSLVRAVIQPTPVFGPVPGMCGS